MTRTLSTLIGGVLLVAACGGGGGAELSKDEFVKQANAICDSNNKVLDSAASSAFPDSSVQPSDEQISKFTTEVAIPNLSKQLDQLDKLKPPKDIESAVDKLLSDARGVMAKVKANPLILANSNPFADLDADASALGLTSCGSEGGS